MEMHCSWWPAEAMEAGGWSCRQLLTSDRDPNLSECGASVRCFEAARAAARCKAEPRYDCESDVAGCLHLELLAGCELYACSTEPQAPETSAAEEQLRDLAFSAEPECRKQVEQRHFDCGASACSQSAASDSAFSDCSGSQSAASNSAFSDCSGSQSAASDSAFSDCSGSQSAARKSGSSDSSGGSCTSCSAGRSCTSCSAGRSCTSCSAGRSCTSCSAGRSRGKGSMRIMADYIAAVIQSRSDRPRRKKVKVHEVILVILLNSLHGGIVDLGQILAFCDPDGKESDSQRRHFKTLDTEAMGLLWQLIKGNTKGNYDTFARAMRVRRERSRGFFEYLDEGKGRRKKIYKLGAASLAEMGRLQKAMRDFARRRR